MTLWHLLGGRSCPCLLQSSAWKRLLFTARRAHQGHHHPGLQVWPFSGPAQDHSSFLVCGSRGHSGNKGGRRAERAPRLQQQPYLGGEGVGARSFSSAGAEGAQHKGAHCLPPRSEGSPSGEGHSGPKRKLLGLQRHPGLSSAGQRSLCPIEASATCSPGCVLSGWSFPEPSPVKEPRSLHPGLTELRVILMGGAPGGSTALTKVSLRVPQGRETTAVSQVCSGVGGALLVVTRAWSSPPPPLLSSTPRFVQDMTEYCWQGGAPHQPRTSKWRLRQLSSLQ